MLPGTDAGAERAVLRHLQPNLSWWQPAEKVILAYVLAAFDRLVSDGHMRGHPCRWSQLGLGLAGTPDEIVAGFLAPHVAVHLSLGLDGSVSPGSDFVWAVLYVCQGALPDMPSAAYFSAVTYTTTGYGDVVLPEGWRLVGAVEALTGILMCGLSTGFFFAMVSRSYSSKMNSNGK